MNVPPSNMQITTPLKALWHWLMAKPVARSRTGQTSPSSQPAHACISTLRSQMLNSPTRIGIRPVMHQPLRVLRVIDTDLTAAHAGRLRISGRMADVCAELDRLAACEARLH